MAGVTAKRAPRGFSEKGTGDDCARLCSLFASFLPFLLSFFSVFVSLIIRRLVSIALFERVDDVDGWTDDAR